MRLGDPLIDPGSAHVRHVPQHPHVWLQPFGGILAETADSARRFLEARGRRPCLAAVLVGEDPASRTYVRTKRAACDRAGIDTRLVELATAATTREATASVRALSADPGVDGILVQHPVPTQLDERAVFEAVAPGKDVDGVTMHSFAAMAFGLPGMLSCTPGGIMRLLDAYGIDPACKHAVVIGRSPILGKPVGMLLLARDATVTYCHSRTEDLAEEAARVASYITPVPGGVGPMTIAVLLAQTVSAAHAHPRTEAN